MPLFQIQDSDRPMWVVADTFSVALQMWQHVIATENEMSFKDVDPPLGINYICDDDQIIADCSAIKDKMPQFKMTIDP